MIGLLVTPPGLRKDPTMRRHRRTGCSRCALLSLPLVSAVGCGPTSALFSHSLTCRPRAAVRRVRSSLLPLALFSPCLMCWPRAAVRRDCALRPVSHVLVVVVRVEPVVLRESPRPQVRGRFPGRCHGRCQEVREEGLASKAPPLCSPRRMNLPYSRAARLYYRLQP